MSLLYVNQNWESDVLPGALSGGAAMTRSATNVISGSLDLRWHAAVAGPVGLWQLNLDPDLVPGSRRGLMFQMSLSFKSFTTPTGEAIIVMRFNDVQLQLSTANKLSIIGNDLSSAAGATALGSSARQIDWEIRHETDTGLYSRVWLDGALEATLRDPAGSAETVYTFAECGSSSGKAAGQFIWGDLKIWQSADAQ